MQTQMHLVSCGAKEPKTAVVKDENRGSCVEKGFA
jgi:hypothetical protein